MRVLVLVIASSVGCAGRVERNSPTDAASVEDAPDTGPCADDELPHYARAIDFAQKCYAREATLLACRPSGPSNLNKACFVDLRTGVRYATSGSKPPGDYEHCSTAETEASFSLKECPP